MSFSAGLSLKAVGLPDKTMGYSNKVFASREDVQQLCGGQRGYVDVQAQTFLLEVDPRIDSGTIAFNSLQRQFAKIGLGTDLYVKKASLPKEHVGFMKMEVDLLQKPLADHRRVEIKDDEIETQFREQFREQVLCTGQPIAFDFQGVPVKVVVLGMAGLDLGASEATGKVIKGMLEQSTELDFTQGSSGKLQILSDKVQHRSIFRPDFNFEELGIGGLSKEFGNIFRRAFASRVFPPHIVRDLGINHVRGMLLYGPPGTGKTLIARQFAKFLKAAEPKIVNGPELLNKYVGQGEENIRNLFADAEREYKQQGDNSQLHVIICDEFDSMCKSRGTASDSTGTNDSMVNQLLSKIDGVDSLNNILLIGMTNRIDLIDEAVLRPGRLEVHVEINLPDENGRNEILNIHTKHMGEKGYMDKAVSIPALAAKTKNFSGAELAGFVRAATSHAMNKRVNFQEIAQSTDMGSVVVTNEDFELALEDIKTAFGQRDDEFDMCVTHGITSFSSQFEKLMSSAESLISQVRDSESTPMLSVLLHGAPGSGKTALSAHLARISEYPFVRRISPENYVGFSEMAKLKAIAKVFEDAYKSPLSVIVLDDLERLMEYVRLGPRFSNAVLQGLFALLKKQPPKIGRKLLVIGTSSDRGFLEDSELLGAFSVALNVPTLTDTRHFEVVLEKISGFTPELAYSLATSLDRKSIGIKTLLGVAEMAAQRQSPVTKDVFMECLQSAGSFD